MPRFVEFYLATDSPRSFPITEFPSLPVFCLEILKKFSRSRLKVSARGRLGAGSQRRPVESQYQKEFHCGFDSLLGSGHGISSEWSGGGSGHIDFRITEPKWGIELLRDGDRLTEHCQRFENSGRYWNWVLNGWIRDWIILDCRHTMPKPFSKPISTHLIFLTFGLIHHEQQPFLAPSFGVWFSQPTTSRQQCWMLTTMS